MSRPVDAQQRSGAENLFSGVVRRLVLELGLTHVIGRREAVLSGIGVRGLDRHRLDFRHVLPRLARSFRWHGPPP
jgi:hypothetical protein